MTNREFISIISENLKAINIDQWIPPRQILTDAETIIADFVKKDNQSNSKLYKCPEVWNEIDCLPMAQVPITECNLDVYLCEKLMRSKITLPEMYSTKAGGLIEYVANQNFSKYYIQKSPKEWTAIQKRQDKTDEKYYFLIGSYIYIPIAKGEDATPDTVKMKACFRRGWEVEKINKSSDGCVDCNPKTEACVKPLESRFVCPTYLEKAVKDELLKQYAQVYLKINQDNYPNQNNLELTNQRNARKD